ncbi:MerR family transcriptional regulator [Maridesulfovibrio ferrireducens]|uniref:MerR family transcriptional regulator n=1 Tax=Maridesulfovibrio ferrireducens TaxID=246191 RepID=UPI001A25A137|nr:MerR family transcriptional regulator [Maridesulfovibrio ferrireducens]MBI9112001.1 methyltransferase domain-containing protein [Maridesulfovibrio ferrireducens]
MKTKNITETNSKNRTIGRLAKKFGLSRSTLLYYDSIELLSPSSHLKGDYRTYSNDEEERLSQICHYRKAGIPLKDIKKILDAPGNEISSILESRLKDLNDEIGSLHEQRQFISGILKNTPNVNISGQLSKELWTELLRSSGFSEDDMHEWHKAFEKSHPDKHQQFLEYLQIPKDEIALIRKWSVGPQLIIKIKDASERYMNLFFKFFDQMPKLGPGSTESTLKALSLLGPLKKDINILDIGCGTGTHTIDLCKNTTGHITALDNREAVLEKLKNKARETGCEDRITTTIGDMNDLGFAPESFDIIWSEGSLFIMGFENGLSKMRDFLKPDGFLAVSELVWTSENRPEEAFKFWTESYPEMKTIEQNIKLFEKHGYEMIAHFIQPATDWWDEYYAEMAKNLPEFVEEHKEISEVNILSENLNKEMDMMRKYPDSQGYAFYLARKK